MRHHSFLDGARGRRRAAAPWPRLALVLLALTACGPAGERVDDVDVELSFDPPPHVGDTVCSVRLTDAAGAPVTGAILELEGNMNHAGMVPVFAAGSEADPGTYEAPLEFTMGGDWFVIVRAELADGRALEEILDVPGVPTSAGAEPACCPPESR